MLNQTFVQNGAFNLLLSGSFSALSLNSEYWVGESEPEILRLVCCDWMRIRVMFIMISRRIDPPIRGQITWHWPTRNEKTESHNYVNQGHIGHLKLTSNRGYVRYYFYSTLSAIFFYLHRSVCRNMTMTKNSSNRDKRLCWYKKIRIWKVDADVTWQCDTINTGL